MSGELTGKTSIVTGASRGIGKAIAERFADAGSDLVICSRSKADIVSVAKSLSENHDVTAVGVTCDVTETDDIETMVDAAVAEFGGIDVLVNNAGGSIADEKLHCLDEETWDRNLEVNLKSEFLVSKAVLPIMIDGGGGAMVHMSSVNGMFGIGHTAYSAARSGVFGLSRLIATQYGRHGIRSNVIVPATIETDQRGDEMEADGSAQESAEHGEEWTQRDQWIDQYPVGRFGEPEEVANATVFLASEQASFVNGTRLPVDGGLTAGLDWSFQQQIYDADKVPTRN